MKGFKGGITMRDQVTEIGKGSIIQHGKHNDRIYLIRLCEDDLGIILQSISNLAKENDYSKIFCKVPKYIAPLFFADGYILEAYIPAFFNNKEDVFFLSKFLNSDRLRNIEHSQLKKLHNLLTENMNGTPKVNSAYKVRILSGSDVPQMTEIYSEVFKSYPFPIHNPEYILKTMHEDVVYFGAEKNGKLAALASSEIDREAGNAEMTDFATHPAYLGNRLSGILLRSMEEEMKEQGVHTLYTIARLNSLPMNKTFLRNKYRYSGTLIKNTNISGRIESMNVYYKHL
jgi:putative beta-lysine N-acetyltransferase